MIGKGYGLDLGAGSYFLLEGVGNLALGVPATAAGLGSFDYLTLVSAEELGVAHGQRRSLRPHRARDGRAPGDDPRHRFRLHRLPELFRRLLGLRRPPETAGATSEEERSSRAYRKA